MSISANRRNFLKGTGVCLALPWLETFAKSDSPKQPKRMIIITHQFGSYMPEFFPKNGTLSTLPKGLLPMDRHKKDMTVIKNVDLSFQKGHAASKAVLSDVQRTQAAFSPDGGITVDARAAEHYANDTRFPMLNLWGNPRANGSISYSRAGSKIPAIKSPVALFDKLYKPLTTKEVSSQKAILKENETILDAVNESAKSLSKKLTKNDRERLDAYFQSIRDTENKISALDKWVSIPKEKGPQKTLDLVKKADEKSKTQIYSAFMHMMPQILQADSSRVITMEIFTHGMWDLPGIQHSYHTLTHHGQAEDRIKQLLTIDHFHMKELAKLIDRLKELNLFDSTQILYCSGMSDGNAHSNRNLPLLLAGGGYKHGQCLDMQKKQPLSNLYNTMLQKLGIETERFNKSTGTML